MNEKKVREAIELLEICVVGYKSVIRRNPDDEELLLEAIEKKNLLETAIEALEKQVSKKTKVSYNENIGRHQYHCPICGNLVLTEDITTALFGTDKEYCDNCGQKLDWSEQS